MGRCRVCRGRGGCLASSEAHLGDGGKGARHRCGRGRRGEVLLELLHGGKKAFEFFRVIEVGCLIADLVVDLGEGAAAESVLACTERSSNESTLSLLLSSGVAVSRDVFDAGKAGDKKAERGDLLVFFVGAVFPGGAHGHGVFADGDADAEGGGIAHADRANDVEEVGVLALFSGSDHPVGGELAIADVASMRCGEVGEAFADGNAAGGGRVEDSEWRAFTDGHRFAGGGIHRRSGYGDVGDRGLPGADHLVARDHAGDAAVGDGDEEGLVRNGEAGHGRWHPIVGWKRCRAADGFR